MSRVFDPGRRARLDAPERAEWQKPDEVVAALGLEPGATVADVGAGTGYFTFRIAEQVGPAGRVFAVDLQQEMLDALKERAAQTGAANVIPVLSGPVETGLDAASVDLVFAANVVHEYRDLGEALSEFSRVLKPGGRLAVVDWKPEQTPAGPPLDHRLSPERILAAARAAGFSTADRLDLLPYHYFLFLNKAAG